MIESNKKSIFAFSLIPILAFGMLFSAKLVAAAVFSFPSLIHPVFAEDDEDEEEDEEDERDEDDEDEDDGGQEETRTITVTRYETRTVSRVVSVLPDEYRRDTDGDGLVDGIDPNPTTHQKEFFTDTDGDSIPNAFDQHHDEDDFSYFNEEDANGDGIIDSYVWVPER